MSREDEFCSACLHGNAASALRLIPVLDKTWCHPSSGWSLLHVAVEHNAGEVIRQLVRAGVNLESLDASGWTPLCLAVDSDIDGSLQNDYPCDLKLTRLLLSLGADPNGGRGITPREIAAAYGDDAERLVAQVLDAK